MHLAPRFVAPGTLLLTLLLATASHAQTPQSSTLPLNPATGSGSGTLPPSHHTEVTFTDGTLTVSADGAGLNGIIHQIARETGMHVSGTVADLPVFGTYGPSTPSTILSTLLDGTGSNILLVEATATTPAQLTLTRRNGSATPPNPNAASQNEPPEPEDNVGNSQAIGHPQRLPTRGGGSFNGQGAPADGGNGAQNFLPGSGGNTASTQPAPGSQPSTVEQPVTFPPAGPTGTPSTGSSTPVDGESANGVKTPQQIFEQLQRLRQQQQNPTQ